MNKIDRYILLIWAFAMTAIDFLHSKEDTDVITLCCAITVVAVIYFLLGWLIIYLVDKISNVMSKLKNKLK